jgi:multidrug efflux pump subunit AcrB
MGLIMVIGIVAKNGILLLDADEKFRVQATLSDDKQALGAPSIAASPRWVGDVHDLAREAMLHAAQRRLRPIVMTAIAAVCGMLPLAFAIGAGSQMLQPLAIAVIGGLLISVVLSLIVTPAIYYRLTRRNHS